MPGILARYLLWEIIKIFVVSLASLTVLLVLVGVVRQLLREGLGPMAVVQLIPYVLPIGLQFALPATLLFAVCCVYGRASADGEISALKAVGISPLVALSPALGLALLLSPAAVWLGDLAVSWGRPGVNRVVMHSLEEIVYRVLRTHRAYSTPKGLSIHVSDVVDRRLISPTITLSSSKNEPLTFTASEGYLELDPDREMLVLRLVDVRAQQAGKWKLLWGGELPPAEIPLQKAVQSGGGPTSPSELPLWALRPESTRERGYIAAARGQAAAVTGLALATGRLDDLGGNLTNTLHGRITGGEKRLLRLQAEPWRRWAGGFSCFFFALVGTPLAIRLRSADYWTTFGMCFLPILMIYYPAFLFGVEQAKFGSLPPYSVWLGNGLLTLVGGWLVRLVYRY
jgi:lipopolysaccharide export system permease protein